MPCRTTCLTMGLTVTSKIWSNIVILMNQRTDKPVMFVSASLDFKTIQDQSK